MRQGFVKCPLSGQSCFKSIPCSINSIRLMPSGITKPRRGCLHGPPNEGFIRSCHSAGSCVSHASKV
uniref:Uncharacterized protein n=1 Tax=Picea glauca TaxID=3330 RepID=A0A101M0V9_PICGL|nr:hypothetical protein ABT39_MTgene4189 [Picea glauca]